MDHSLSPASQPASVPATSGSFSPEPAHAAADDDEPDSPGRSPRSEQPDPADGSQDPLAESLGLLGGILIGVLSLLVPLATVIACSDQSGDNAWLRSGAAAESPESRAPEKQWPDR